MHKIVVERAGHPEVLGMVRSDAPKAAVGQVLVEVEVAGVNYLDVYLRDGVLGFPTPFTPGFEGVGRVLEIGEGVDGLAPGQRIACIKQLGSYAEQIALPAEQAIALPDGFTRSILDCKLSWRSTKVAAEYLLAG